MHPGAAVDATEQQAEAICLEMTFVFRVTHQCAALHPVQASHPPQAACQGARGPPALSPELDGISRPCASAWWRGMYHLTRGPAHPSCHSPVIRDQGRSSAPRQQSREPGGAPPSFQSHPLECTGATWPVRAAGRSVLQHAGSSVCQTQGWRRPPPRVHLLLRGRPAGLGGARQGRSHSPPGPSYQQKAR